MHQLQPDFLLTVGIPTFERAQFWPSLIENLELLLSKSPFAIELVVIDNFSSDQTWDILCKWRDQSLFRESIVLKRQSQNVGPAKNLVDTMSECRGRLYTFIGDDDRFEVDEFIQVISTLSRYDHLHAAIHVPELQQIEVVSVSQAFRYLYQYGNAWMGVIRSDLLRQSLANQELVNLALSTIWPQTILGLSQLRLNDQSRVLLFPEAAGRRTDQKTWTQLTQPTSEYFINSFEGLLDAAMAIHDIECRKTAILSVAGIQSPVRKAHQLGMAKYKQATDFARGCQRVNTKLRALDISETRRARAVFVWIRFPVIGRQSYVLAVYLLNSVHTLIARIRKLLVHLDIVW